MITQRRHGSCCFQAKDIRCSRRRRRFAHPLQHIRPVHAGGCHFDQYFARLRALELEPGRESKPPVVHIP